MASPAQPIMARLKRLQRKSPPSRKAIPLGLKSLRKNCRVISQIGKMPRTVSWDILSRPFGTGLWADRLSRSLKSPIDSRLFAARLKSAEKCCRTEQESNTSGLKPVVFSEALAPRAESFREPVQAG